MNVFSGEWYTQDVTSNTLQAIWHRLQYLIASQSISLLTHLLYSTHTHMTGQWFSIYLTRIFTTKHLHLFHLNSGHCVTQNSVPNSIARAHVNPSPHTEFSACPPSELISVFVSACVSLRVFLCKGRPDNRRLCLILEESEVTANPQTWGHCIWGWSPDPHLQNAGMKKK